MRQNKQNKVNVNYMDCSKPISEVIAATILIIWLGKCFDRTIFIVTDIKDQGHTRVENPPKKIQLNCGDNK